MTEDTKAKHVLDLSRELLDDIELSRLSSDKLILKASRLARIAGNDEINEWLKYEIGGYNDSAPISIKYLTNTGRWIDFEKKTAYFGPFAQQEDAIRAMEQRLVASKLDSISGDGLYYVRKNLGDEQASIAASISRLSGIRSRVIGLLHNFVSGVYYSQIFSDIADGIFQRYKHDVDALIAAEAADVVRMIPAIAERLREGDSEAISQALTTCRRVLEAFADAIYPPADQEVEINGNLLKLDATKHQNRINVYVHSKTPSKSRRNRLRQNLSNLFDRVSTGVHKDVTTEEAFSLFLNVYLFLGEILHLDSKEAQDTVVE